MMNEETLRRVLHELAEQEITDDMNLWNNIQAQLNEKPASRDHSLRRLAQAAAVVLIFLAVTTGAYALYQAIDGGDDPVLEAIQDAGLVTELNLSQTIGETTVTLDWGYADTQTIAVHYTITGTPPAGGYFAIGNCNVQTSQPGGVYPGGLYPGSVFRIGDVGNGEYANGTTAGTLNYSIDLFSQPGDEIPEEIRVRLELDVNILPIAPSSGQPSVNAQWAGRFVFNTSLPSIPAVITTPMETVVANDIALTLRRVAFTPSGINFHICPEAANEDVFENQVSAAGGVLTAADGLAEIAPGITAMHPAIIGAMVMPEDNRVCTWLGYSIYYSSATPPLTLTVQQLVSFDNNVSVDDEVAIFTETFAEYGIEATVNASDSPGGYPELNIEVISVPEGVDYNAVYQEAWDRARERIEGPWVFTIEMP